MTTLSVHDLGGDHRSLIPAHLKPKSGTPLKPSAGAKSGPSAHRVELEKPNGHRSLIPKEVMSRLSATRPDLVARHAPNTLADPAPPRPGGGGAALGGGGGGALGGGGAAGGHFDALVDQSLGGRGVAGVGGSAAGFGAFADDILSTAGGVAPRQIGVVGPDGIERPGRVVKAPFDGTTMTPLTDALTQHLTVQQPGHVTRPGETLRGYLPATQSVRGLSDVSLYNGPPAPEQVRQGALKDCPVVAVLAATAQANPQDISDRLKDFGNRAVLQTDPGHAVAVDHTSRAVYDTPTGGTFHQAQSADRANWPVAYEMAEAARFTTGYEALDHGLSAQGTAEFMTRVTGRDARVVGGGFAGLQSIQPDVVRNDLTEALLTRAPVVTGVTFDVTNPEVAKLAFDNDVINHHEYWVRAIEPEAGLVQLGNPHGPGTDPKPLTIAEFQRLATDYVVGTPRPKGE